MSKGSETRHNILQKAFELIYVQGYQATSIDDIIATTHVTKGSFFYHFKNKDEMGLALINEIMLPGMDGAMVQPLHHSTDPATDIYNLMDYLLLHHPLMTIKYGCPAGNLTQEMSPVNDAFSTALSRLVSEWQQTIITCIENGKKPAT